jgi:urease accessory protein
VRYLGQDTEQARNAFTALWQTLRPALIKREAVIPRIWLT